MALPKNGVARDKKLRRLTTNIPFCYRINHSFNTVSCTRHKQGGRNDADRYYKCFYWNNCSNYNRK